MPSQCQIARERAYSGTEPPWPGVILEPKYPTGMRPQPSAVPLPAATHPSPQSEVNTSARRVLAQLRAGPMTVEDLARTLHVTPNAVRNQLVKLQATNFVVRSGTRPGTSKPSAVYSITMEGHAQFSTIYLPLLTEFLRTATARCSPDQFELFMGLTGKSLARRYPSATGTTTERANAGARLLRSFGVVSEVRTTDGALTIRGHSCPLAALTSENPAACHVLEALFTECLGLQTKICCSYDPEPKCCFEVTRSTASN